MLLLEQGHQTRRRSGVPYASWSGAAAMQWTDILLGIVLLFFLARGAMNLRAGVANVRKEKKD